MTRNALPAWTETLAKGDKVNLHRGGYGRDRAWDTVEVTRITKTSVFVQDPGNAQGIKARERRFIATGRTVESLEEYGAPGDYMRYGARLHPLDSEAVTEAKKAQEFRAALADIVAAAHAITDNQRDAGMVLEQLRRLRGAMGDNFVELAEGRGY